MTGLITNDGDIVIANLVFVGSDADRGSSLQLGLLTNSSISKSTTLASITEPTGGGYARITLANASWTTAAGVSAYAEQTFTATGSAYAGTIYGYFIATTGTTPKLLAVELDPSGSFTMAQNDTYKITPSIPVS